MLVSITTELGYIDGPSPEAFPHSLARGSKNLYPIGSGRFGVFPGYTVVAGELGHTYQQMVGNSRGGVRNGRGNLSAFRNSLYLMAGDGGATGYIHNINSASPVFTIPAAPNRQPQIRIGGAQYPLGIPAPSPPVIAAATAVGTLSGTFAFKGTYYRSSTRGESNASEPSNVLAVSQKMIKVTVPGYPAMRADIDYYRLYVPFAGYATIGPFLLGYGNKANTDGGAKTFMRFEFPIGASSTDYYIEYNDGDLLAVNAPYFYFQPPETRFLAVLGGYVVCVACYAHGEFHVSPSIFQRVESFDPDGIFSLNPPEPVTGCLGTQTDGLAYVFTRNAIAALVLTGATSFPVISRNMYNGIGVASSNQACTIYNQLVALTGQAGLIRAGQGSEPDTEWTAPVQAFTDGFDANAALVEYDPHTDMLIVAGDNSVGGVNSYGNSAWALGYSLKYGVWSAPLELPYTPASKVVDGGRLYLSMNGGLYTFASGGGLSGVLVTAPQTLGNPHSQKTVTGVALSGDMTSLSGLDVLDALSSVVKKAIGAVTITNGHSGWKSHVNAPRLRSFAIRASFTGSKKSVNSISVSVTPHEHRG